MTSKVAGGALWEGAVEAIREFNGHYEAAQKLLTGETDNPDAADKLLGMFAFRHDNTVPSFQGPFREWAMWSFYKGDVPNPEEVKPDGKLALAVIDGKAEPEDFLRQLETYKDALDAVIKAAGPERFTYNGFKIWNPERLGDKMIKRMMEGVDYLVALFKKRGVTPMLRTGIRQVEILPGPSMAKLSPTASGLYIVNSQTIVLSASIVASDGAEGRFIKWVREVFLHEFGHYVHMSYLPRAAKEAWDEGWAPLKERQSILESISGKERQKFFAALEATEFNLKKAVGKIRDPLLKVKFAVWLRSPMVNDPLITPKQLRWTKMGRHFSNFFLQRERWITMGELTTEEAERLEHRLRRKMGLDSERSWPVRKDEAAMLAESDPIIRAALKDALDKLEIVSEYGKKNEKEDFAETFVAFMGAPNKITPTAKFRMQRALSLANFYNKPVMRLAKNPSLGRQLGNTYDRRQ